MKIISLPPRGWANTYLITEDGERAIVIDPSQPFIQKDLQTRGLTATHVLLTHCHFDHVGGVATLQRSGARVYCSAAEKPLVGTEKELFQAFGLTRDPYTVDETFFDGEEKELCGVSVKGILTPGHTAGSCCYLFTSKDGERCLFTGDTLFMDSVGRTDFPTGNTAQMRASLRKLKEMEGDIPVYAGHNERTTLERERTHNPFMQDI